MAKIMAIVSGNLRLVFSMRAKDTILFRIGGHAPQASILPPRNCPFCGPFLPLSLSHRYPGSPYIQAQTLPKMDYQLFLLCQLLLAAVTGSVLWAIRKGLLRAYHNLGLPSAQVRQVTGYILGGLILWLAVLAQLALSGFFAEGSNMPLQLLLAYLPPVALGLALWTSKLFRILLRLIPAGWFITVQVFRVPLEIIRLVGYLGGFVPVQLTMAWLNYDIFVGLSAVLAARVFFYRGRIRRVQAMVWHVFGFILLCSVQVLAWFSAPSPYRAFSHDPPYWLESSAPFIWIGGLLVPVFFLSHVYGLLLLWKPPRLVERFLTRKKKITPED